MCDLCTVDCDYITKDVKVTLENQIRKNRENKNHQPLEFEMVKFGMVYQKDEEKLLEYYYPSRPYLVIIW